MIEEGEVSVNDEVESRIRRKLRKGDIVEFGRHAGVATGRVGMIKGTMRIETLQNGRSYDEVILTTPAGRVYNQKLCNQLSMRSECRMATAMFSGTCSEIQKQHSSRPPLPWCTA